MFKRRLLSGILTIAMAVTLTSCSEDSADTKVGVLNKEDLKKASSDVYGFTESDFKDFDYYILMGPNPEDTSNGFIEYEVQSALKVANDDTTIYYYEFATPQEADTYYNAIYTYYEVADNEEIVGYYDAGSSGRISNKVYYGRFDGVYYNGNVVIELAVDNDGSYGKAETFLAKMNLPK